MQEKLIILRKKRGVTQKQLAEYLGITEKTYGLEERGEFQFTLEEMFKLRDFFGKGVEDIFLPCSNKNGDKTA